MVQPLPVNLLRIVNQRNKNQLNALLFSTSLPFTKASLPIRANFKQTEQITTHISHFPYTFYNFHDKENFFFLYPVISIFNIFG